MTALLSYKINCTRTCAGLTLSCFFLIFFFLFFFNKSFKQNIYDQKMNYIYFGVSQKAICGGIYPEIILKLE